MGVPDDLWDAYMAEKDARVARRMFAVIITYRNMEEYDEPRMTETGEVVGYSRESKKMEDPL